MTNIKQEYLEIWLKAYNELNEKQRQAVDTIEGPVMTIAGPGTGKTQLLAVRIGNILLKTDISAHNILCLTYTEAGAIAMRQRLCSFIGTEAYNVSIHTFHAFCNSVIKENLQYFGDFRDLQQMSDIEEAEIYRTLIDGFSDDHLLKRFKGDEYYEARRLKNLFATMKQEKWSAEDIKNAYEAYENEIMDPLTSPFRWGRSGTDNEGNPYKKGDFNVKKAEAELNKYKKGVIAAFELANYNKLMRIRERYDYHDMILWVIDKFIKHDDLLGKYQERFQYIMVDEYQDTNGSQNELLFLLADYWDRPNLFIVGDDDQSIFRFQGANMNSIMDFKEKYDPVEIVLTENYRSSQKILDRAKLLIEYNEDRLVKKYPNLIKELTEARSEKPPFSPAPEIIEYTNEAQEEAAIVQKIIRLHHQGVPYKSIAVIYTKHKTAENLVRYFMQKRIPINVKKRVNVLYENEVYRLTNILEYLDSEYSRPHSAEDLLFEILHYDFLGLNALDIASVAILCRKREGNIDDKTVYLKWREVICDPVKLREAGVRNVDAVIRIASLIENWVVSIPNVTIQTLIEKILTEGNVLNAILIDPDKSWKLQLINTFFDFVKNEASRSKLLTLKQTVALVKLMRETNIELPLYRIITSENGINLMTAHGSKGLEFDHVFIMRCQKTMWEDKSGNNDSFALPPTLTASSAGNKVEDDRRLFYVAMTRAKDFLYVSYTEKDASEKSTEATKFVSEIRNNENEIMRVRLADEEVLEYKTELMKYQKGEPQLIDHELIDKQLQNFKISATSLNKYLKCKLSFYFENILKVPMGRSAVMGFGNAVHYALEHFFRNIEPTKPNSLTGVDKLVEYFFKGMELYRSHFTVRELENYSKHGVNLLNEYYDKYASEWMIPRKYELEYSIPQTVYEGVPISGKLDRIDIYDDYISVTDYKTGNVDTNKLKPSTGTIGDIGGDYWRQIIFYRLLLDGDKRLSKVMKKGYMDFVEKDKNTGKYRKQEFIIDQFEKEIVGQQLISAYNEIKNHIFTPGCGKEDCKWCNFVLRNMPVDTISPDEENSELPGFLNEY